MIIAPRKKGCQRGLVEQGTVTGQGKGNWIGHKIKQQDHHLMQHPIELYRMLKTLINLQSFQCWLSATSEPDREVLVYALHDTQSNTTFLLEEMAKTLHTRNESV